MEQGYEIDDALKGSEIEAGIPSTTTFKSNSGCKSVIWWLILRRMAHGQGRKRLEGWRKVVWVD